MDKKRLRELFSFTIRFISAVALVLTAALFILAPVLMRCFMDNEQIVSDGTVMLRWQVVSHGLRGHRPPDYHHLPVRRQGAGLLPSVHQPSGCRLLVVLMVAVRVAGYSGILASPGHRGCDYRRLRPDPLPDIAEERAVLSFWLASTLSSVFLIFSAPGVLFLPRADSSSEADFSAPVPEKGRENALADPINRPGRFLCLVFLLCLLCFYDFL